MAELDEILAEELAKAKAEGQAAQQQKQAPAPTADTQGSSGGAIGDLLGGGQPPIADTQDSSSGSALRDLLGSDQSAPAQAPQSQQSATPAAPPQAGNTQPPLDPSEGPSGYQLPDAGGGAGQWVGREFASAGGGVLAGLFHTYDFFTGGEPQQQDKTPFRQRVEAMNTALGQSQGVAGSLAEGIGEFAPGLIATDGLLSAATAAGKIGTAIEAGTAAAPRVVGALKGAVAGALSLDPHGGNIANLINTYVPALSNPVTDALAARPDDTEAMGRLKNALGSLGFDAATAGLISGATGVYHYLGMGNAEGVSASAKELAAAQTGRQDAAQPLVEHPLTITPADAPAPADTAPPSVRQQIDDAYLNLTGGQRNKSVYLSDLRKALPDIPQDQLDAEFANILKGDEAGGGTGSLHRNDDPRQLTPEQQEAAYNPWGEPFHALWSKGDIPRQADSVPPAASDTAPPLTITPRDQPAPTIDPAEMTPSGAPPVTLTAHEGNMGGSLTTYKVTRQGQDVGYVEVQKVPNSTALTIHWAGAQPRMEDFMRQGLTDGSTAANAAQNTLGPGVMRQVIRQLGNIYPDADRIGGFRLPTGVREGRPGGEIQTIMITPRERAIAVREAQQAGIQTGISNDAKFMDAASGHGEAPPLTITPRDAAAPSEAQAPEVQPPSGEPAGSAPQVDVVPTATEAGAPSLGPKPVVITPEEAQAIADNVAKDVDAVTASGGDYLAAIQRHHFGSYKLPWQRLGDPSEYSAMMGQLSEAIRGQLDAGKGGAILPDDLANSQIGKLTKLFQIDPSTVMGQLMSAGQNSQNLLRDFQTSLMVAQRATQDAYGLAARIRAGDLDEEFGGDLQAAQARLAKVMTIGGSAMRTAVSIRAGAGRALRSMRADWKLDPTIAEAMRTMDPEQLSDLMLRTNGDPSAFKKLTESSFLRRITDRASFYMMANLLSRPETHWIGAFTNTAQMLQRPAERILGSFALGNAGASIREQAFRQYYFMGASLMDGFRAMKDAFLDGDSKIAPHANEVRNTLAANTKPPLPFSGDPNFGGTLYNGLVSAVARPFWYTTTLGPRLLGAVDEMHKTITYRSMVLAKAHMEGTLAARGLLENGQLPDAAAAKSYVANVIDNRMAAAFDKAGFATDAQARMEAEIATFSQPLLPGTIGKGVQDLVANHPGLRVILPFVRGPTNILRYAWKMTPGLNYLQGEYRDMLSGRMGQEAQAQATGQMALGTALLGSAAFLASEGLITGGYPKDPQAAANLRATGWQPYSFVIRGSDGSTSYIPYGRYDPVSIPLSVVADIVHAYRDPGPDDTPGDVIASILLGVSKSIANKTYLTSLSNLMDAATSQNGSKVNRFVGQETANFIPLSAGVRWVTTELEDGYLRDARSITDQWKANLPGASDTLPPIRDAWGNPVGYPQGPLGSGQLYSQHYDDPVDQETQRLLLEQGPNAKSISRPSPNIGDGVDLRQITTADGRDAYDKYQELAGHLPGAQPLRDIVKGIMTDPAYAAAPDGPGTINGTKLHMLEGPIKNYRDGAMKMISADPNVAAARQQQKLKVAGAYATKQADPTGAQDQARSLAPILNSFGLGSVPVPHQ